MLELSQLGPRTLGDDIAAATIDRPFFAVDRKPVALCDIAAVEAGDMVHSVYRERGLGSLGFAAEIVAAGWKWWQTTRLRRAFS